ncbi:MAG: TRAP transporter large permease [Deltaproteobacteria bacterium HGW-Deltaproteobacteria-15]|jgi:tripartite ATP-independent transporter DctM subunit|nr:MAG: TRAP transporter large permease [Deltaproteobacteria bacterium HGW-Deltaproteobacteria-15]
MATPAEKLFVRVNQWIVASMLGVMFILVFANVVTRYCLGFSIATSEEVSTFLMIAITYLGAGLALREGRHASIDFLQDRLSETPRRVLRAFLGGALLLFFLLLAYFGVKLCILGWSQETSVTQIPRGIPYLALPIGSVVFAIHLALIFKQWLVRSWEQVGPEDESGMTTVLFLVFFLTLALGLPVSMTMGLSGMVAVLVDGRFPAVVVPQHLFNGISSFPLMAVPFFVLAADLMTATGLTASLMQFANNLVGHIRGGLGHVNVLVSMLFAGVSGSALADAAGPGAIEMSMMRKAGYDAAYAGALSAATATIGPIIPPSILMVIYAISDARVTVAGLFLAGIGPGILLALALAAMNHWISIRRGYVFRSRRPGLGELTRSFGRALPSLGLPFVIMAGILGGMFTPTEAAAVAVAYSLLVGFFLSRTLRWGNLVEVFTRSSVTSAGVLLIVSMASIFSWLLTILQVPQALAAGIANLTTSPILVMVLVAVIVFLCGMLIDTLPALIILVPVLGPLVDKFHIDPLYFAMAVVLNLTIGLVTPPVGPVLFVISTVGRVRFEDLVKAAIPLIAAEMVVLIAVIVLPPISTFIPMLFGFTH